MTTKGLATVGMLLRHNIKLAGDVSLARAEFKSFSASAVRDISRSDWASSPFRALPEKIQVRLRQHARADELLGFVGQVPLSRLAEIIQRIAFAQDLVILADWKAWADSPLVEKQAEGVFSAVPVAALCEFASHDQVLMSTAPHATLDQLLSYLLRGQTAGNAVRRIVESKNSTLALSHDLHIYKAKFFPRFVRALLNIYRPVGEGVVLDPFSGSGTALLEASALGYETIGIDVDPISAMISDSKVRPFVAERSVTRNVLRRLIAELSKVRSPAIDSKPSAALSDELRKKIARRDSKDGTNFLPEIESDLRHLQKIRKNLGRQVPELLDVLFSDAVTKKIRYRYIGVGNGKYTIEIVRQRIVHRLQEKARSMLALCDVFEWLEQKAKIRFAESSAVRGNAVTLEGLPPKVRVAGCITSPPYLPASSGREHYASSRALAFSITDRGADQLHAQNAFVGAADPMTLNALAASNLTPAGRRLLAYLTSDSENCDPQRDPMRFERKAIPTYQYLLDIESFLRALRKRVNPDGVCIVVVASQHLFYSHRRQEIQKQGLKVEDPVEYIAKGRELYGEIAERAGWDLEEEVVVELAKSAVSTARPRSSDEYSESALVLRPAASRKQPAAQRRSQSEILVAA